MFSMFSSALFDWLLLAMAILSVCVSICVSVHQRSILGHGHTAIIVVIIVICYLIDASQCTYCVSAKVHKRRQASFLSPNP